MLHSNYLGRLGLLSCFLAGQHTPLQPTDVQVQPSNIDLVCFKTVYKSNFLDNTAREACSLKKLEALAPPNCPSRQTHIPFYIKNDIPKPGEGHLLRYPLAKLHFSQKGEYEIIVFWNPEKDKCQAVAALYKVHGIDPQRCQNIRFTGWGNSFEIMHSDDGDEDDDDNDYSP